MLPDGKGGLKEYNVKEVHSLRISRSSRIKFEKLIGFMPESPKDEKLKKLNESVEVYYDKPIDAIKSLEYFGVEEVYDSVLNNGLAHFKDTGLPMSEINNNSVVYGHASNGNYYERTKDVAAAFTKLTDIKIGDEVIVKIEGKEYKYRVVKTKLVKPDDISIINGTRGKKTLTLFTCPNGNNAKRFVAVARPV